MPTCLFLEKYERDMKQNFWGRLFCSKFQEMKVYVSSDWSGVTLLKIAGMNTQK
jgi:hypothetical protein